jgi:hypothetical protein
LQHRKGLLEFLVLVVEFGDFVDPLLALIGYLLALALQVLLELVLDLDCCVGLLNVVLQLLQFASVLLQNGLVLLELLLEFG